MSSQQDKVKNSKRRFSDLVAIKKQLKIARAHGLIKSVRDAIVSQTNRFRKHHAMDCGTPNCKICGNPRSLHMKDSLTAQEKRLYQDLDVLRNKKSNGSAPTDINQ